MIVIKKVAEKIFGKPMRDNSVFLFGYWASIIFYALAVVSFGIYGLLNGHWISFIIFALLFPILFRVVYKLNVWLLHEFISGNKKPFFITAFLIPFLFGIVAIGGVFSFLLFGDHVVTNVANNVTKNVEDGNRINVSIDSLKGTHQVEEFTVTKEGLIIIPFDFNITDGEVKLILRSEDGIVWSEKLSVETHDQIHLQGKEGHYKIELHTKEAKNIKIQLDF
ncbi:hypothetical protein [Alkalihalobacterium bogoriense]|uniref:hypothetical protein n=1 Tax=Alkalihalobacterium bogoriense TaxID=246272 RepID=UPI00047DAF06|nr:hypothetical protein [Alkalihalobacterium bogoriense]